MSKVPGRANAKSLKGGGKKGDIKVMVEKRVLAKMASKERGCANEKMSEVMFVGVLTKK